MNPGSKPPAEAVGARLSIMMFLQFFVWGAWYVSAGPYMEANGMKDSVKDLYSVVPIAAIISPFFLGIVADRFFATERILGALHIVGGILLLLAPTVAQMGHPHWFLALFLLHALCYVPTLGLTNSISFHNIVDQEKKFPLIRVFGTIGWIVANIVVSTWLKADTTATQFFVAGSAAVLLGLYSFTLPHTPPPAAGQKASARDILGLDALSMLKQPSFAVFIISSFLICIPLAAYYSYAGIYAGAVGFQEIASTMSFGQMSEIFFMLVMPIFFVRFGVKRMLMFGMLAWAVRYGLFAAAAPDKVRWMVLSGILLHGICYDFFFVTGQIYVDKKAPRMIRAQAQGFLVLVTQGLGALIGAQTFGMIVKHFSPGGVTDWQTIWIIPCVAAAAVLVVFAIMFRDEIKAVPEGSGGLATDLESATA